MENIEINYPFPPKSEQDCIVEQYEKLENIQNKLESISTDIDNIIRF